MTNPNKKLLNEMKTDNSLVTSGCTKYIQEPNMFWNKTFKGNMTEFHD